MRRSIVASAIIATLAVLPAVGQDPDSRSGPAPIYRVTVIERTLKSINYRYRSGPTSIDFRGTVLLPKVRGEAIVESRQGRTEIDARIEHLAPPARFGREYLTYVLWAITPEGRPHNIAEIIPNGSDKASFRVTTDLQAFGLIVTAEPYSAVRRPSDVVVAENQVREDTLGKIEEINAKYELLPRGHYTWNVSDGRAPEPPNAPKLSMKKYEALLELYQAQNAINIAQTADADRYAPVTIARARQLLEHAQQLQDLGFDGNRIVEEAREAAQTAEDARMIGEQRQQEEKIAQVKAQASAAREARAQADADADRARADARAAQAQADAERAARQRAEAEASEARQRAVSERAARAEANAEAEQARAAAVAAQQRPEVAAAQKSGLRRQLRDQLNGVLATRDSARGLIVTVPDRAFSGAALRGNSLNDAARVGALVAAYPGLRVDVEGHTDVESTEALSSRRAAAVRDVLLAQGLPSNFVFSRGYGDSHPLVSNTNASGREQNRRVEIVISGDPIGTLPLWDSTYPLTGRR
jgi:outer membrane protein OmpA-like peptidoglycan-associated protein